MSTISFEKNTSMLYSNTLSKKGAQQEESLIYCTLFYTTLFTERQCNKHAQVHIEPFFPNQAKPSGFLLFLSELVRVGRAAGSPSPPQVVPLGRLALPTNAQECLGEGLVPCVRQLFRNVYECFGMTRNV